MDTINVKIHFYTTNPSLTNIFYDENSKIEYMPYAEYKDFISAWDATLSCRGYEVSIEEDKKDENISNYHFQCVHPEDPSHKYNFNFEISDTISPFQEYDSHRRMVQEWFVKPHCWWIHRINVNGIPCYHYNQAIDVLDVLLDIYKNCRSSNNS